MNLTVSVGRVPPYYLTAQASRWRSGSPPEIFHLSGKSSLVRSNAYSPSGRASYILVLLPYDGVPLMPPEDAVENSRRGGNIPWHSRR